MPTSPSNTLDKGLRLLQAVIDRGEAGPIAQLALGLGIQPSTAHRLMVTLQRRGFVAKAGRGRYLPGPALIRLGRALDLHTVLDQISRPLLLGLARATGLTAHLGVFEGDMVTYLVKASGRDDVLTQEGMQLEAYCSGIGKVLLSALPDEEQERYLASGPFVRLTANTIVEPSELRSELRQATLAGYAVDDGEIDFGLRCIAAPVRADDGRVCAAISLSAQMDAASCALTRQYLAPLLKTADAIERRLTFAPVA